MLERLSSSRQEKPFGVANGRIQRGNLAPSLLSVVDHMVPVHFEPELKLNLLFFIV